MNTQAQVIRVEAGQALPRRRGGAAVLTEGELLMHEPARWLAGMVVLPSPVRLVAPATLPAGPSCAFVATHASVVVVQETESVLASGLRAVTSWIRGLRMRGQNTPKPLAG